MDGERITDNARRERDELWVEVNRLRAEAAALREENERLTTTLARECAEWKSREEALTNTAIAAIQVYNSTVPQAGAALAGEETRDG